MKSRRRSSTRSAPAFQHRLSGKGPHHPVQRLSGRATRKRASTAVDLEKLLHFSQQLYAHALTLQEVIRNEGEVTYEILRPRYDRQAAQQFEVFYHSFNRRPDFRARAAGSCE